MKTIKTYITEALRIKTGTKIATAPEYKCQPITKKELPRFVDKLYNCLDRKEPANDKEKYIAVYFCDRNFFEVSDTCYINIDDLENHTDKDSVITIFYNLAKRINNKYTCADIMMWDPTRNDYCQFARATLRERDRMWHPEYIKLDKHPFV